MTAPRLRHHHVALRVADVDASLQWYAQAFGAHEAARFLHDDGTTAALFVEYLPGHFFELFPGGTTKVEDTAGRIGYRHVGLIVEDLHATLTHLAQLDITPLRPARTVLVRPLGAAEATAFPRQTTYVGDHAGAPLASFAFVSDPDGNQIELLELPQPALLWG
jgi:catechol 2,3-dioxygenase-like lactoylglutathione lyase family enzyme